MHAAWIRISMRYWAAQVRATVTTNTGTPRPEVDFFTGFVGATSYATGFTLVPPIVVPPLPAQPANVYDIHAKDEWKRKVARVKQRVLRKAIALASYRPPRELGTDLRGCVLRAASLGARDVLFATDLLPFGRQQTAVLKVMGMRIQLLYFCASNNAAACDARLSEWVRQLENDGATVHVIDPAEAIIA